MTQPELLQNIAIVGTLIVLEGLLSADNALVLAILVRHLPKPQQTRALKYGIAGAFFFRAIGVLLATYLVRYWQFKAAGAAYLLYLAIRHIFFKYGSNESGGGKATGAGFWKTVALVELTDVAFSVDSIVAAVAMSQKLWVVYLGGILGIITMRFVAGIFLKLLERFPALEGTAYALVGWIGLKLGFESVVQLTTGQHGHGLIPTWLFWTIMAIIFIGGLLWPKKESEIVRHAQELKDFQNEEVNIFQSK